MIGRRATLLAATLGAAGALALALSASAGAYIYWGEDTGGSIGRAANDGTHVESEFITGIGSPNAVAVDAGHIYWTDEKSKNIGRARIDGSEVEPKFIAIASPADGVAVNGTYIFWSTMQGDTIGRANIDSSSPVSNLISAPNACGVALDSSHVYWVSEGSVPSFIGRASFGGLEVKPEFGTIPEEGLPCGIAVSPLNIFWGDRGLGNGTRIGRADLSNGSGVENGFIEGVLGPCGLAVFESHLYWANFGTGTIGRANLNGNEPNPAFLHTGGKSTCGIAVDSLAPSPPPNPGPPGGGGGGGGSADTTPPETKIVRGPGKKLAKGKAKFVFTSSEAGSTFACKLDGKTAAACRSPKSYSGLKPGRHSFRVWATDAAGNKDPSPAKRSFRVPGSG
jgi:hypothetical protein